jgi:hypothetical protein
MFRRLFLTFSFIITLHCFSQQDSIRLKNGIAIPCHILKVTQAVIELEDQLHTQRYIDLYTVRYYIKDGIKTEGKTRVGIVAERVGDTVNVSEELAYMRFCMSKFHAQYTTGLSITLLGGALAASSLFLPENNLLKEEMGIGGVVITIVGLGVSMDAHKWFSRAGWGVSGKGNRMKVVYRFK